MDLGAMQSEVLRRWMLMHLDERSDVSMNLLAGHPYYSGTDGDEFFVFDASQDFTDGPVYMSRFIKKAESVLPGLGAHLMATIDEVNYRFVDILTPQMVVDAGDHVFWYGEQTDEGVLAAHREWNAEVADEGENEGDEEEPSVGVILPSEYYAALGPEYEMVKGKKRWTGSQIAASRKALVGNAWGLALLDLIEGVWSRRHKGKTTPVSQFEHDGCSQIRIEPSYQLWWSEHDSMEELWDQVHMYRMEGGEPYQGELLTVDLKKTDLGDVVNTVDKALAFLQALNRLVAYISSDVKEMNNDNS